MLSVQFDTLSSLVLHAKLLQLQLFTELLAQQWRNWPAVHALVAPLEGVPGPQKHDELPVQQL